MDVNKILNADFLDILFDGKNKEYGAYQLRKNYPKTMAKALIITAALLVLVFLGSLLANKVSKNTTAEIDVLETQMADIKKDEPLPPPPPPEINQVKFVPPKVVKDEEVKPDEKIEEVKEDQAISTKTVESENKTQVVQAPVEDKGTQVVEAPKDEDENKIFNLLEFKIFPLVLS